VIDSLTRNATDFEKRFRRVLDDYQREYGPALAALSNLKPETANASSEEIQKEVEWVEQARIQREVLEYQIRLWVIDGLLFSLNWIQNSTWNAKPTPVNMLPEMTVKSIQGTKRRMDYFGYERSTYRPLLIVEAKRPSDKLPTPPGGAEVESVSSLIVKSLRGRTKLPWDWSIWLDSLKDYVRSVKAQMGAYPARAVLTNGDWCVIFASPENTFAKDDGGRPEDILVFKSCDEILERAGDVFLALEHHKVLGTAVDLTPGELRFAVDVDQIRQLSFGLRLRYVVSPTAGESDVPIITVVPLVLARSATYSWIRITGQTNARQLPPEYTNEHLLFHVKQVHDDAVSLMKAVERQLNAIPTLCSVEEHYASSESFSGHPGLVKVGDCQVIFTGSDTHFFRAQPSVSGCQYHDWLNCQREGIAQGKTGMYGKSVLPPRAFFESGTEHHCAHRDVFSAKQSPITPHNRSRCGSRSGGDSFAFCEIAPFEDYLCCRTCVFETVCTAAKVFRLPCGTHSLSTRKKTAQVVQIENA
jgi:hypothetical protein